MGPVAYNRKTRSVVPALAPSRVRPATLCSARATGAAGRRACWHSRRAPRRAGLERGNGPEPSTLDAHRCQEVACGNVLRDLYEGLVGEDAAGGWSPAWRNAGRSRPTAARWTFRLRDGLRWSNGEPLDAAQVVASFRRAFAPATAAPFAELFDALRQRAGGAGRAAAAERARRRRAGRAHGGVHADPQRLAAGAADPADRLSGVPAGGAAHGAQHTRPGNSSATAPTGCATGRRRRTSSSSATRISTTRARRDRACASRSPRMRPPNCSASPPATCTSPRRCRRSRWRAARALRRAAAHRAVPRRVLARHEPDPAAAAGTAATARGAVARGRPRHAHPPRHRPRRDTRLRHRAAGHRRLRAGIGDVVGADPGATRGARKALYRAAGYSTRQPLVIELRYNTSTPHRRLALAVAAMWREVLGVQVRLRNEEWKVFVGNRKQRVITQVFRGGWIADVPDARNFLAAFGSDGPLNWTGFDDAGFRERLAKADAAKTEAARNAWLHAAESAAECQRGDPAVLLYVQAPGQRPTCTASKPIRWIAMRAAGCGWTRRGADGAGAAGRLAVSRRPSAHETPRLAPARSAAHAVAAGHAVLRAAARRAGRAVRHRESRAAGSAGRARRAVPARPAAARAVRRVAGRCRARRPRAVVPVPRLHASTS